MALILAIEPDKKQASVVRALARGVPKAQIIIADSAARGVQELDGRIPDLTLTSLFLSPEDEAALDEYLHGLDGSGHRVPTLVIPVLAAASRGSKSGGLLKRLKKPRKTTGTEACDPATFAAQITEYLDRAAAERALDEDEDDDELPIAALPARAPLPPADVDEAPIHVATHVSIGAVGRILFAASDDRWDEIPLEATDASLEIIAEPIDLNALVEELEAVVSSYGKTIVIEAASEIELSSEPITAPADPPLGLATLYAWPALEGVPAGMDWETTRPGDPDYEILAEFMEAFETPTTVPAPSAADPISDETVLVDATPVSSPPAVDRESWVSLSMRTRYNWPPLEGVESLDAFAAIEAEGPALRREIAVPPPAPPVPAPPAAQWLETLTAIRRDIQELRAEHRAGVLAQSDDSTKPASVTPGSSAERQKAKTPQATLAPAAPARKRKRKIPPKQDEWGFFDPDQCGFAALLAKLEEIEGDEPTVPTTLPGPEQS